MLSSVLFCLLLPTRGLADPAPRSSRIDDTVHCEFMKMTRRGIATLESLIELDERLLREQPDIFTPERASRMREGIEEMRRELGKMKKWERELALWEQQRQANPGRETDLAARERLERLHRELWGPPEIAPPPREKK